MITPPVAADVSAAADVSPAEDSAAELSAATDEDASFGSLAAADEDAVLPQPVIDAAITNANPNATTLFFMCFPSKTFFVGLCPCVFTYLLPVEICFKFTVRQPESG